MAKLHPTAGGCWFCHKDDENETLMVDHEFDTLVHKSCLQNTLNEHPDHSEAVLMKYLLNEDNIND